MSKKTDAPKPVKFEDWQLRLKEERDALYEKLKEINNSFSNSDIKMSKKEWEMLLRQSYTMKEYLSALNERCVFYGLIEDVATFNNF